METGNGMDMVSKFKTQGISYNSELKDYKDTRANVIGFFDHAGDLLARFSILKVDKMVNDSSKKQAKFHKKRKKGS